MQLEIKLFASLQKFMPEQENIEWEDGCTTFGMLSVAVPFTALATASVTTENCGDENIVNVPAVVSYKFGQSSLIDANYMFDATKFLEGLEQPPSAEDLLRNRLNLGWMVRL